jgi:methylornithine synthase
MAGAGGPLDAGELAFLLGLEEEAARQRLFRAARALRTRFFGDRVFLYGFLYAGTWCRNDCAFCFYRKSNASARRYRKETAQAAEVAARLAGSGVHLIDLTLGEDPLHRGPAGFEALVELAEAVRRAAGLPLMVSPGVVPAPVLEALARAGASWYACYQETHNRALFRRLRPGQSYDERLAAKAAARRAGLLVEEGVLCGVGETAADLAESVRAMGELGAAQVRAMTFIPGPGIPLAGAPPAPDPRRELTAIAVLRLAFPDRLIPASLDVDGLAGLEQRLRAGANVVTSLIPPGAGLAGVARSALDIEEGRRTAAGVEPVLDRCGLQAATAAEYRRWVDRRRKGA